LHKIYLLPEAQGKGGWLLIDAVAYAKENHSKTLSLNVNRFNKAALL
jgi:GNAT superfamily N-acetyltransferase